MRTDAIPLDDVRGGLRGSVDPRAARTRDALFAAVHLLEAEGSAITASAIARRAGLSRSVFYTHFADVADLVLRMQEPLFDALAARATIGRDCDPGGALLDGQTRLVEHFDRHRALYRVAYQAAGHDVLGRTEEAMAEPLERYLEAAARPEGIRADLAARHLASATAHLLRAWVMDEIAVDPASLAQHLFALCPEWLRGNQPGPSPMTAPEEGARP